MPVVANAEQPGSLDSSFANEGVSNLNNHLTAVSSMATLPSGDILATGQAANDASGAGETVELNPDGSINTEFGQNGAAYSGQTSNPYNPSAPLANLGGPVLVSPESNGDILLVGMGMYFPGSSENTSHDIAIQRLLPDGSLDTSFGEGGTVNTNLGEYGLEPEAATVTSSGKIVVTGIVFTASEASQPMGFVAQLNTDGTADNTFNGTGVATIDLGPQSYLDAVTYESSDNSIVVGGAQSAGTTALNDVGALVKYTANGQLDSNFGNNGLLLSNMQSSQSGGDIFESVTTDSQGNLIAADATDNATSSNNIAQVDKFTAEGTPVSSFASNGTYTFPSSDPIGVGRVELDSQNNIVLGGWFVDANGNLATPVVARLLPSGVPDSSFGNGGIVSAPYGGWFSTFTIDQSNKLLAGGTDSDNNTYYGSVARFLGGNPVSAPTNLSAPSPTQTPVLSWDASDGATYYNVYRNGTLIDTISSNNTTYTDNTAPEGTNSYYVTAVINGSESVPSNSVSVYQEVLLQAINSGGGSNGSFVADTDNTGGATYSSSASVNTSNVPTNAAPQSVYQSSRYGSNFSYTLPGLTAGNNYTLMLHFDEPFWGVGNNGGGPGSRVFNVSVNGTAALSNYDIYKTAGGANRAVTEEIPVTADSDGKVTVQFSAVKDNAIVSGIQLFNGTLPTQSPHQTYTFSDLISAGSSTAIGNFAADYDFNGGTPYSTGASVDMSGVTNPAPESVYQSSRYGSSFSYTITSLTPGATYNVQLDFNELYFGVGSNGGGVGSRVFNVGINGTNVLNNFDIYATAGGANKAVGEDFTATADGSGNVIIQFTGVKNNAMVSGIEVTPQS